MILNLKYFNYQTDIALPGFEYHHSVFQSKALQGDLLMPLQCQHLFLRVQLETQGVNGACEEKVHKTIIPPP